MLTIHADQKGKNQTNFWNNFHFHPTDAIEDEWGQKILNQAAADRAAGTVRMYAMLEDIVSLDEKGNLQYDFTLNDTRLDYMLSRGFDLFLSYNFLPPCLAEEPESLSAVSKNKTRYKGKMIVTSRPRDYAQWEEICYRYTEHIVGRYGLEQVKKWQLQCYNEPDAGIFFLSVIDGRSATTEDRMHEYCKLYRGFARGVMRVSPELSVGGPALAGDIPFLRGFLQFVRQENLPLSFLSVHSYGTTPRGLASGEAPLSIEHHIGVIQHYREIGNEYFPGIPVVVDEWGASTCGYLNIEEFPQLMFREHELFSAYYGCLVTDLIAKGTAPDKMMLCLSGQHEMTEDFSGFRNFFTLHFIRKPIYNAYCLLSRLGDEILACEQADNNTRLLATRCENGRIAVLVVYAAPDFCENLPDLQTVLSVGGITGTKTVKMTVIDKTHHNPYRYYEKNGLSAELSEEQIARLRQEGELTPDRSFSAEADGTLEIDLTLGANGIALVEF